MLIFYSARDLSCKGESNPSKNSSFTMGEVVSTDLISYVCI